MKSITKIDKELLEVFQHQPPVVTVNKDNLHEMREFTLQFMSSFPKTEKHSISVQKKMASLDGKNVPVIVYTPTVKQAKLPGILHIHGGGFILGNAEMCENYCIKMAHDLESVIVSVDYRLAPENPFPAGLEDCYLALRWMQKNSEELLVDETHISITGESGGGGIAAQLSFLVRDRKEINVNFVFLTYPMLDNRTGSENDPGKYMGEFFWTRESNQYAWSQYQGNLYPGVPSQIENVEDLPPTYIAVGTLDLFASECIEYTLKLAKAGVDVEMHLFPGATHGFDYAVGTSLSDQFFSERKRVFSKRRELRMIL